MQGALTDSWFLGALSMLATNPELLSNIFVGYTGACDEFGIYTLRFFKNGKWEHVTVDNRLPCKADGSLLFSRCAGADPTELWVSR